MAPNPIQNAAPAASAPNELVLTRRFEFDRERVFLAWTKAEVVAQWFSPRPYTITVANLDFREGGVFEICMRGPQGDEHWMRTRYDEIRAPELIVFTGRVETPSGQLLFSVHTRASFAVEGKATILTISQRYADLGAHAEQMTGGARMGWTVCLDQLAELLD